MLNNINICQIRVRSRLHALAGKKEYQYVLLLVTGAVPSKVSVPFKIQKWTLMKIFAPLGVQ